MCIKCVSEKEWVGVFVGESESFLRNGLVNNSKLCSSLFKYNYVPFLSGFATNV